MKQILLAVILMLAVLSLPFIVKAEVRELEPNELKAQLEMCYQLNDNLNAEYNELYIEYNELYDQAKEMYRQGNELYQEYIALKQVTDGIIQAWIQHNNTEHPDI